MNKKALDQDKIEEMLANLCERPSPEKLATTELTNLLYLTFEMGKQWEVFRQERICSCPRSADCWNESEGKCTHL